MIVYELEFWDKVNLFFGRNRTLRKKIRRQLTDIIRQSPKWEEFKNLRTKYQSEFSYSMHMGSYRDGSESDWKDNVRQDKKVDILKGKLIDFAEKNLKFCISSDHVPLLSYSKVYKDFYWDFEDWAFQESDVYWKAKETCWEIKDGKAGQIAFKM